MAKKKVSELDRVTSVQDTDLLYLSQSDGEGAFNSKAIEVADFATDLGSSETFVDVIVQELDDIYVNTTGDTMTGNLEFVTNPDIYTPMVIQPLDGGSVNIASSDLDTIVYMHLSTADTTMQPSNGGVITGRFRYAQPIDDASDTEVIDSSSAAALVAVDTLEAASLLIRKNDGTSGSDWFLGNWFEVWAEDGVVELEGQTAGVHLIIPDGKVAITRADGCKMKAVLVRAEVTDLGGGSFTHDDEYWLISGDLADAP